MFSQSIYSGTSRYYLSTKILDVTKNCKSRDYFLSMIVEASEYGILTHFWQGIYIDLTVTALHQLFWKV